MSGSTWIQTLNGGKLDLVDPDPRDIDFGTIATVLSRVPRFGGHTRGRCVYSVAQHCVEGANAIVRDTDRRDWALAFLLHDAHEAFVGDMPTPVANALATVIHPHGVLVREAIAALKYRIDVVIYGAAGVPLPLPDIVKEYDLRMLRAERDACLAPSPQPWDAVVEAAVPAQGCDLHPWAAKVAEVVWMGMFQDLRR